MKEKLKKFKYPLIVMAVGIALMLLPGGEDSASGVTFESDELRLAQILESTEGVGHTQVLISEQGAVVVCDGAEDASVKLAVTEASKAFTGLGSDKIVILKSAEN